jgi:hypothetical protein
MSRRGLVHLVGVGPGEESWMSLGALRAIRDAEEIWCTDLGSWNAERLFLRKYLHGKKVVNLSGFYALSHVRRGRFYRMTAARIAHLAARGRRITYLASGSPLLWVDDTVMLKRLAAGGRFDLEITPSMSFLDIIWRDAPFDCGEFQLRVGRITRPAVSPEIDCVVGQIGDTGVTGRPERLDRFDRDVRRLYPASHPVFVAGTDPISSESTTRLTSIGQLAKALRSFRGSIYSVVIPGRQTDRRVISTASLAEVSPTRYESAANQLSVEKERTASGPWRRRRRRRRGRRP